jgi:hypothetical protein
MPKLSLNINILSLLADNCGKLNTKSEAKQAATLSPMHFSFQATATYEQDLRK